MGSKNGIQGRRLNHLEKRLAAVERAFAEKLTAVAQSAGSALAVEALTEIVGRELVGKTMAELMKQKQGEVEREMAGRVATEVTAGRLEPIEVTTDKCLIVGERTEGEAKFRVDLVTAMMPPPACLAFLGKRVGDVIDEGATNTVIREIYGPGKGKPKAEVVEGEPEEPDEDLEADDEEPAQAVTP